MTDEATRRDTAALVAILNGRGYVTVNRSAVERAIANGLPFVERISGHAVTAKVLADGLTITGRPIEAGVARALAKALAALCVELTTGRRGVILSAELFADGVAPNPDSAEHDKPGQRPGRAN
jgi:ribosomal protein S9